MNTSGSDKRECLHLQQQHPGVHINASINDNAYANTSVCVINGTDTNMTTSNDAYIVTKEQKKFFPMTFQLLHTFHVLLRQSMAISLVFVNERESGFWLCCYM